MAWRNRVEVSYAALRHNVSIVRQLTQGRALVAVVKADAYGLGLERCARIYHEAGADLIAVASLGEADRVRSTLPEARVVLLGSPLAEERASIVASGYEVCCSTHDELTAFASLSRIGRPHPVHLFVDTGMGRSGCLPEHAPDLARYTLAEPRLRLAGVASHYPQATDPAFSSRQESVFASMLTTLPPLPSDCLIHMAASEGLLLRPTGPCNAVRVGILLTGVLPGSTLPDPGLHPAVRWVSAVNLVKRLPAGHGVSYGRTVVLGRDSTVALVPVGYADGYPWAASGRGRVLMQGRAVPILGRVTMDYLIIDVTDLPRTPHPGDPVVLLGRDGQTVISVNELAETAGTIPYDVLCGLRGRCEIVGVA